MKKAIRTILVLLLCLAMVAAAAGCTSGGGGGGGGADNPEGGDAAARDTMNVAVSLDSGTLDPMGITGTGGFLNAALTYMEPLLYFHEDATPEYVLATAFEEVSDTHFTVKLREGVKFSNGNPFTAEDVLFTMEREKDDPSRMLDVQYVDWEKTKIVDDLTIDLWFSLYSPMNLIKISQMLVYDAESFDAQEISMKPVGTGAYVVKDYVVNSHLVVEANPDYWGEAPKIKTINFKCLNEESQVINALDLGEVDYAVVPMKDVEYVEGLGPYSIESTYSGWALCSYYNMSEDGLLASKDARDAISYATDSQSILDVGFYGYGEVSTWPASAHLVDYEDRFANMDDTYKVGYDLKKAEELAKKAGLVGKTIRLATNGAENFITFAEILQASLGEIGVKAEITNYDQATYYSVIMDPSNYEVALYFNSAPSMLAADVLTNYPIFFPLGWKDSEREPYIAQGTDTLATPDVAERGEKLFELTKKFLSYAPWFAVCETQNKSALSKEIQGLEWLLAGSLRYQDWSFK